MDTEIVVQLEATIYKHVDGEQYAAIDKRMGILAFGRTVYEALEELDASTTSHFQMVASHEDLASYLDRSGVTWSPRELKSVEPVNMVDLGQYREMLKTTVPLEATLTHAN